MTAPTSHTRRNLGIVAGVILALAVAKGCSEVRTADRHFDELALTGEITRKLAACGERGQFPASLSELQLGYPERSTPSMLRFYEYRTTGTNCTLKVAFPGSHQQEFSFP